MPDLQVGTGQDVLPNDERAEVEAESLELARPVEDMSQDRSWLSHRLLNTRTILSFVLAFGIIIFLFTRLDINPAQIWSTMLSANPAYLVVAFMVYYSAFWVRGGRWKKLLNNVGYTKANSDLPSVNGLVEITYLSWFVNCIVPAKLGDAYRSYLLKRNSRIPISSSIGTILAERVIDLLVLFGLLLASFMLIGNAYAKNKGFDLNLVMVLGGVMAVALILGLVALRFFGPTVMRFVPHRFREKFEHFQHGTLRSFKRSTLPALLGFTIVIWLLEGGRLFFVTRSLDAQISLSAVIFIALLSSLITTIPATPGGAGLVEGGVTLALGLFLKDHQLALSIALLDRVINYWSLIAGGIVLYLFSKRK